jgi:hypothetical protein
MGAALATDDDPLLGAVLAGTYRIEKLVAEGGMGRLYAGVHERLGMPVAVKVLLESRGGKQEAVERMEREARAMASMSSPNVARVLDIVRADDGRPCLVTELLKGEDLAARIERDKKLERKDAARIARDMCLGLAEAHEKGVLHRDIKPSNVFLTDDGQVKVIDFGVAKVENTGQLTHAGAFVGTPAYMSPEQAASSSGVDERSEVYAVGAVLYHMLSGQPPYGTLDATQTLTALLRGEPPRLSGTDSAELAALVERAMSRDPKDRFSSMRVMADQLLPHAGEGMVRAASGDAKWLRTRAILAVLASALCAALWTAALTFEIGDAAAAFGGTAEGQVPWPEWAQWVLRGVPALAMLVAVVWGLRELGARWRSAPRVEALVAALRRTVWIAIAALGVTEAARPAAALFELRTGVPEAYEGIASLVLAVVFGALVALISAQFRKKETAPSA